MTDYKEYKRVYACVCVSTCVCVSVRQRAFCAREARSRPHRRPAAVLAGRCACECDSEDRTSDDGGFAHPLQDDVPTPVFGEPKPGTTAPANQNVLRIRPLLAVVQEIGKVLQLPAGRESGMSRRQHQ